MSVSDNGDDGRQVIARELGNDLLIGALAIAQELNWQTDNGSWDKRRVYHVASHGQLPIHNVKGLGLCARRSSLNAFFEKLDSEFV